MTNRNLWQILKTVSVEPVIFCNAMAISFHNVVYRYGIYRVICQKMYADDPDVDCADLSNSTFAPEPEFAVQRAASDWQMQLALTYMIPATFADILLGALGDRYGRKFNIQLGMFGMMLAVFPAAIIFSYPLSTPMYVLLIANFFAGLTGFVSIVVISSFAYLADTIIDRDLLTVRMTLLQVSVNVGSIFGPLLASAVSQVLHTSIQEVITLSLLASSFIVALVILRQVPPAEMRKKMAHKKIAKIDVVTAADLSPSGDRIAKQSVELREVDVSSGEPNNRSQNGHFDQKSPARLVGFWKAFVQALVACFNLMKEVWSTYTKRREGRVRGYMLAAFFIVFVSMAAEMGLRQNIFGLYVQKAPLSWNQDMIGYYESANNVVTTAGTVAGIFVFKKMLGFADTTVVLIALASGAAESLLIAFGDRTWMLFLSAVVGCLSTLVKPCLKSFVAKLVEPDEVGKAFTVFGIAQNIAYLVSAVVYNRMYKATLETFPGFVYVFAAIVVFLIFGLVIWVHVDQKLAAGEKWRGFKSLKTWISDSPAKGKEAAIVVVPVQETVEITGINPAPA